MRFLGILFIVSLISSTVEAQDIPIVNNSFEGKQAIGSVRQKFQLNGWADCGSLYYPYESPPDVHPIAQWGNLEDPLDGETFVGLVIRENNTWESIAQQLVQPMEVGQCYEFSIAIKASESYLSGSSYRQQLYNDTSKVQFTQPTVLRIWGSRMGCGQEELLGESPPVSKQDWHNYTFTFKPTQEHRFIMLEAYYKVPVPNMRHYNGHIMIDKASDLIAIPCPEEPDLYASVEPISRGEEKDEVVAAAPVKKPVKKETKKTTSKPAETSTAVAEKPKPKRKFNILTELNEKGVKKGQVIEVKKLFFVADDHKITRQSADVIEELYQFLSDNPTIRLEIGGHTNSQPAEEYCNKLSTLRAEEVANQLIARGIAKERIETKGYGKNKPIASNKTIVGRKRNQRVEIKILSV